MTTSATPRWVARLRGACPRGWSVREMKGKVFLSVRAGKAGSSSTTTKTLPVEWTADSVPAAITLITDLHQQVQNGIDLADALRRLTGNTITVMPSAPSQWPALLERFHDDLKLNGNQIKPTTWKDAYAPFLNAAIELMTGTTPPVDARELGSAVVNRWATKPRSRELAVNALSKFLDFGVQVHGLPANSWTLSDRDRKHLKGRKAEKRTKATLTDLELLRLLDSLPSSEASIRWGNAIKLMALYGLRPEELNHLTVREHPTTGTPVLFCTYRKVCGSTCTEPRWLMPIPLVDAFGQTVEWNLSGAMAVGQLPLPPLSDKFAVGTFLRRQAVWSELSAMCEARGEWLRPYVFRDSYSLRAHQQGRRLDQICTAMGHSLAVHQSSYVWSNDSTVLEAIG